MAGDPQKNTSQTEAFVNIAAKIGKVLSKTKEAILADLEKEILDIRFKALNPDKKDDKTKDGKDGGTKDTAKGTAPSADGNKTGGDKAATGGKEDKKEGQKENKELFDPKKVEDLKFEYLKNMVDAVFVKLGYDFSDCENLKKFTDKIMVILQEMEKIFLAFENLDKKEDYNAANLLMVMAPAIKKMIEQIQKFVDEETDAAGEEVKMKIEGFDHKALIRRIVEYVFMTLLKNAKQVFSAEIEFIEMKVQLAKQTIDDLKKEITTNFQKVKDEVDAARKKMDDEFDQVRTAYKRDYDRIKVDIENSLKQIQSSYSNIKDGVASNIEAITGEVEKEAKARFNELAVRLREEEGYTENAISELLDASAGVIVQITRVFNITYSILDFAGIIEEKTLTLELPDSFIKAIRSAKDDVASLVKKVDDKVVKLATDIDASIQEKASIVAGFVEDTASKVEGTIAAPIEEAKEELQTVAGMISMSQASVETAVMQMAIVHVAQLDALVGSGFEDIKSATTAVADELMSKLNIEKEVAGEIAAAYYSVKTSIQDAYNGKKQAIIDKHDQIVAAAKKLNEKVDNIIDKLDNFSYQLKYYTINWGKAKDLFTKPIEHFKSVYPVNGLSDAKALAEKFMDMLHLINPDIPDFSSLVNMLETLLKKLKNRLAKIVREIKAAAEQAVKTAKQKIVEFLQPLIDNVKAMIDFIKSVARQLKEEMLEVIENLKLAMHTVGGKIEAVASSYYKQLCLLKEEAEDKIAEGVRQIQKDTKKTLDSLNDSVKDTCKEVRTALHKSYEDVSDELKAAADKVYGDIKSVQCDETFFDEFVKMLQNIEFQMPSLEGFSIKKKIITPALAGFVGIDYNLDFGLDDASDAVKQSFSSFAVEVESAFSDVASQSREGISKWAEGVGSSIMTLTSPTIWKGRLDSLMTQLEAEFQGDMQTLKNLVTPQGAKNLVTNFGATKDYLAANLDINSYITIVKTAVSDIVLPDPELFYDSFKEVVKSILANIKEKFYALLASLKAKLSALKDKAKEKGQEIYDKINAKYQEIVAAFEAMTSTAATGAKEMAEAFKTMLSEFGSQLWKRVKEELIMPVVDAIKKYVVDLVRQLIKRAIEKIIDKVCESDTVRDLLKNVQSFKADAQKIIEDPVSLLKTDTNSETKQTEVVYIESKDKDAEQSGGTGGSSDSAPVITSYEIKKIKEAVTDAVERTKTLANAVVAFTTSEKKLSDTITLVKALYDSVPAAVRKEVSDLLPTLPDNAFTDYCKDLEYETDLDNLFFSVTLLDLGKLISKSGSSSTSKNVSFKADAKIQLTITVSDYLYTEKIGTYEVQKSAPSLAFIFNLEGNVGAIFGIGENNQLGLLTAGALHNIGFCLTRKVDGGYIHAIGVKELDYNLLAAIFFGRKPGSEKAVWLNSEYLDITVKDYPMIVYAGFSPFSNKSVSSQDKIALVTSKMSDEEIAAKGFRVGFMVALDELEFLLKLRQNEMFKQFLKDDISLQIGTYVGYDMEAGLKIGGDAKLHLELDMGQKKLGPVTIESFAVDAGTVKDNIGSFELGVMSSFSIDMNAVKLSLSNMGVSMSTVFLDPTTYKFKSPDFGFGIKWPDAIAVAIDATAVKGSGMISYDSNEGTIVGALQITVINKFGVQGFLLCDTGEKPGHFFSLATMISASFSPGIPLGMGFSLTAIGGALGINRKLDRAKMTQGVRNGTLAKVFFVEDIASNVSEMKKNAESFFPAKKGQFYLGFLGQISYAPVVKCDFGLLLQLPDPVEIIIVGALKVTIGDNPKMEDYVLINVVFAGGINFEEGIWFDASLINSKIVGLELSGDMAFRLFWGGEAKGFLMTIGGFHPAYKPEEGMLVSDLRRLSIGMNYSILKMKLDTYMAVTSNTFQIGANLDLQVGWDKFGLKGYAGFDALFQFDPFMFMFDARAGVAVMLGSVKLLSVDLALNVQGPGPWIVKGNAKFFFVLVPVSVDLKLSWGDDTPALPSAEVSTLELLLKQMDNLSNWECTASDDADQSVALGKLERGEGDSKVKILNPDSKIAFNQGIIPMHTEKNGKKVFDTMVICNNARPVDFNDYTIEKIYVGKTEVPKEEWFVRQNDFAPALYKNLSTKEKIKLPSYESYNSGFGTMSAMSTQKSEDHISIKTEHVKLGSELKCDQSVEVFSASKPMPGDKTGAMRYMKELNDKMNAMKTK